MGYLDEHTRRRVAAVLLVIGAIIAVLAITDLGPFSDPPTQEELAQETVEEFFAAARKGDFEAFCSLLTGTARQAIEVRAGAIAAEEGLKGCAEILKTLAGRQFEGSELTVTLSSVSGNRARVETELKLKGEAGREQRSVLLEQNRDGDWLISDPGFG
jgi:ketosteroid isomerase-like protein